MQYYNYRNCTGKTLENNNSAKCENWKGVFWVFKLISMEWEKTKSKMKKSHANRFTECALKSICQFASYKINGLANFRHTGHVILTHFSNWILYLFLPANNKELWLVVVFISRFMGCLTEMWQRLLALGLEGVPE